MKDYIEKLKKESKELAQKADTLEILLQKFPDLTRRTNRWNKERLCSAKVSGIATNCEIHHNCGCCADSPLEVEPYIEENGVRLYGLPYSVFVGSRNEYEYGDVPYPDWEQKLDKLGVTEEVKEKVRCYFGENSCDQ